MLTELKFSISLELTELEAKAILASKLYEMGKVSLGKASEIAEMPKAEFMAFGGKQGIPVFNYTPEDLSMELETWKKL